MINIICDECGQIIVKDAIPTSYFSVLDHVNRLIHANKGKLVRYIDYETCTVKYRMLCEECKNKEKEA